MEKEDIRELQDLFQLSGTELDVNLGKEIMFQRTGQLEPRKGCIVAIQKIWDYDENGNYTFGIPGYTVYDFTYHHTYACSRKQIEFIEENHNG